MRCIKEIKSLKEQAYSTFERKNEVNYGWVVSKYNEAWKLENVKTLLKNKTHTAD